MTTKEYAEDIRLAFDRERYAKLIASLGKQLNNRKDRFDKADIIEQSIDVYTRGRLKWVDDIGRDHHDVTRGINLEFKYGANCLFTTKRKDPKRVVSVKIKNSLGANKGTTIDNPADYYMIGQQDSIALISFSDLEPFLKAVPDGIEAHIPFDSLDFIFAPKDVNIQDSKHVSYKVQKQRMQLNLIESM